MHGPSYGPFLAAVVPILAAPSDVVHLGIEEHGQSLKAALESKSTQTAVMTVAKGKAAAYLEWCDTDARKHVAGFNSKIKSMWASYAWERP